MRMMATTTVICVDGNIEQLADKKLSLLDQ